MTNQHRPAEQRSKPDRDRPSRPVPTRWTKSKKLAAVVSAVIVGLCVTATAGYLLGRRWGESATSAAAQGEQAGASGWTCSMHPQINLPKPGKCPICFMDLIPLSADDGGHLGPRQLNMSPAAMALARIETTPVTRKAVVKQVRMTGKIDYDETRLVDSTAWVPGRLDELYVDYTGVMVRKGDHLFHIYSPELVVAQDELLLALKAYRESTERTRADALNNLRIAEDKLRLWGVLDEQIDAIKQRGKATDHITIYAPVGGIVIRKHCNEGAYVKEGTPVYTIADLSLVWAYLDAYESDIAWLRYGQQVEFTTESYPGEVFKGRIAFIDPVLTGMSRVIKVRVNVPNADLRLKPGMFVHAVARSRMAEGGRVLDSSLAGKWICPMHPEIVKDGPTTNPAASMAAFHSDGNPQGAGQQVPKCDICGMDLVPAESQGVVMSDRSLRPPLVIPATAPLPTGKRAVVYVQIDPLLLRPAEVLDWSGLVSKIVKEAGGADASPGKRIWGLLSPELKHKLASLSSPPAPDPPLKFELLDALNGLLARRDLDDGASWEKVKKAAKVAALPPKVAENLSKRDLMLRNRRLLEGAFVGPLDPKTGRHPAYIAAAVPKPTFEGRQIALGPRAGDYYIVRYGLAEGERVVTQGNFKIDADLQIKGKTSMMNPESLKSPGKKLNVSTDFRVNLTPLYQAYLTAAAALAADDVPQARRQSKLLLKAVERVNSRLLDDEARKYWEFYKNRIVFAAYDTLDGRDAADVRRSFEALSRSMVRLVEDFGHALPKPVYRMHCPVALDHQGADWLQWGKDVANPYFGAANLGCGREVAGYKSQAPLTVPRAFRGQLAGVYRAYLRLQVALADDRLPDAVAAWQQMRSTLVAVDPQSLGPRETEAWKNTRQRLGENLAAEVKQAGIEEVRKHFEPLSVTLLEMVEAFGHEQEAPLSKMFCPMAFPERGKDKGAPWLQAGTKIANPYFGHKMRTCGKIQRTFPAASGMPALKSSVGKELR